MDTSHNGSGFVNAPNGTVLRRVNTPDVEANAITTITEVWDTGSVSHTGDQQFTELGAITAQTQGGSLLLLASAEFITEAEQVGSPRFELRYGDTSGGTLIKTDMKFMPAATPGSRSTTSFWAVDDRPSGTHKYKLWLNGEAEGVAYVASNINMAVAEIKR
jgi:hypothetical protein